MQPEEMRKLEMKPILADHGQFMPDQLFPK